jgi:hypothetical protein
MLQSRKAVFVRCCLKILYLTFPVISIIFYEKAQKSIFGGSMGSKPEIHSSTTFGGGMGAKTENHSSTTFGGGMGAKT